MLFRQHRSYEEREEVAQTCSIDLHIGLPILIEEMDNAIDEAYGAAPERLYLIGSDGEWPTTAARVPTSLIWMSGRRRLGNVHRSLLRLRMA